MSISFALDDKLYLPRHSLIRDRLGGSVGAKLGVLSLDDLVTGVCPVFLRGKLVPVSASPEL